jgi:AAA+ ATPase superfamily predicted ATPase
MFINRKAELGILSDLYATDRAELFVLYGRRRVGKTELLRAFCQDKSHLFFIATLSADAEQLATFSQQIWAFNHSETPYGFSFPSWDAAFKALADLPGKPIIVLDEFTYLISGNKAIPSILQKVWDEHLKNTTIKLVLCGSYIGMMETEVLGYRAPLYGRRTQSTLLIPLDLPSSALFFPGYSADEQFLAWAILGGMPYYLRTFNDQIDIFSNIKEHILDAQRAELFSEPRLLLMEELREPRNYFSILRAIAQGNTRLNEIAQASGVGGASMVSRYLDLLQQMRLVTRRVPATETQPEKSKRGIYQIDDHFLRFWFRYVHPNQSSLDLGLTDAILDQRVRPDLDNFVAISFEEASRQLIARMARQGTLPFLPENIGAWWDRDAEIDVLAISRTEKKALVGECKWSIKPIGVNVLDDLKQKAQAFLRSGDVERPYYALFSRSGFTPALETQAQDDDVMLFNVDQIVVDNED